MRWTTSTLISVISSILRRRNGYWILTKAMRGKNGVVVICSLDLVSVRNTLRCWLILMDQPSPASTATSLMACRFIPHAVARWLPDQSRISWLGAVASPATPDTNKDKHYLAEAT